MDGADEARTQRNKTTCDLTGRRIANEKPPTLVVCKTYEMTGCKSRVIELGERGTQI
jgi:hypothetical protein